MIAITIVTLFLLFYSSRNDIDIKEKTVIAKSRVTSTNTFVKSMEQVYLPRILAVTAQKALTIITNEMIDSRQFRKNLSVDMKQLMINGSLEKIEDSSASGGGSVVTVNITDLLAEEDRLITWLDTLTTIAREELNLETQYHVKSIRIDQTTPWTARVMMNLDYTVTSPGVVGFNRTNVNVGANFSIIDFIDPYLPIHPYTHPRH